MATPISLVLSLAYAIWLIGPIALVGFFIIILMYPIMGIIAKLQSHYREQAVRFTDQRVTGMKEIIDSIRLIKMYAWEEPFLDNILSMRDEELKSIFKSSLTQSAVLVVSPSISIVAGFGTFIVMTLAGIELDTTQAFTTLSIFSSLQFSISTLTMSIKQMAEANVGFNRLHEFLQLEEYKNPLSQEGIDSGSNISIEMRNCNYSWEVLKESQKKNGDKTAEVSNAGKFTEVPTLFDLSFTIEKGSLTGVAGLVGSGKSSLISAILGEVNISSLLNVVRIVVADEAL